MPINLTISHEHKLVIAVAEGEIGPADVDAYLDRLVAEGAMPYAKLFDVSFAPLSLGIADLRAIGRRSVEVAKGTSSGPLAVVVGSELAREMATIFASEARAERPVRIFEEIPKAREWLDSFREGKPSE